MTIFFKLTVVCSLVFFFACNNSDDSSVQKKEPPSEKSSKSLPLPADSMTREALFSFVDGCVANAKITLGEEKAFGFCKCIYDQIRKENPNVDSTKLSVLVNDTAQLTKMAATCR